MAVPQSDLQGFIQNMAGTQSTAQANVPQALTAGNPNTAYNWASYLPQVTPPAQAGGLPSVQFGLVQAPAQVPAGANGYATPFTPDPYAAMVMAGMPQGQSNDNVNRILGNLFGGNNNWGSNPGTPGTPGTPAPGTPGTGTPTPPANPVGNGGTGGSVPVGPISGGVHQWITNPRPGQGVPDTTATTNLTNHGLGRQGALEWLQSDWRDRVPDYRGTPLGGSDDGEDSGGGFWSNAWNWVGEQFGELGEQLVEEFKDITGQNGSAAFFTALGDALVPGLGMAIQALLPSREEAENMSEEDAAALQSQIQAELTRGQQQLNGELGEESRAIIEEALNRSRSDDIQDYYRQVYDEAGEWSQEEWNDMMDSVDWNNFWNGREQANTPTGAWSGTRRPTLGLPALDNMDVFLNQMNQDNLNVSEWFRNMAGTRQQ